MGGPNGLFVVELEAICIVAHHQQVESETIPQT